MKELYIVDAHNILFRSYFAITGMTNSKGESTNALYGFIRSIYKLMKDFSPASLVVVFDGPKNKEKRSAIYAEYKSHRKPMPDDLGIQIKRAELFCELAGIPHLSIEGVEADDTMGSIAKWAEKKDIRTFLCSSDKDLCQLVSDHVFVVNLHKENLIIDKHGVVNLFGVKPEQMIDYLAIVGDASDNIPGLEGFGPKTTSALLQEFHTLDFLLNNPEKVPGAKKQETLKQNKAIALMSKELATIHTDVDFPREESFFHLKEPRLEKLKEFYQEMNFLSLLKLLEEQKPQSAPAAIHENYILIDDEKSLRDLLDELAVKKEIALDTETTSLDFLEAKLVGIGLCDRPGNAYYIPMNGSLGKAKVLSLLQPFLTRSSVQFYGHNLKYDLHILKNEGIEIPKIDFDTMIASYILAPESSRHGLDELTLSIFGKAKIPITDLIGKGKTQITMDEVPLEKVCHYCCEDVDYTNRLHTHFKKELKERSLLNVFETVDIPLIPVLVNMERKGVYLDHVSLASFGKELTQKIAHLEKRIYADAGEEFNINSPKQLSHILYNKLLIPPLKKTMTGFSTSADVLESLKEQYPFVQTILEYRVLEKLRSTYVEALPKQINSRTGRIHCSFNQVVAATGRLSCQNPNLQNIPVRSNEGKVIRSCFKPEQPNWSFLSADYSQIELRLLAHFSEDPSLIKAFQEGEDIHAFTASLVFNIPLKEVTSEMRHKAKAVNFGILYGQQAFGLSQGLSIPFQEANEFIKTYFDRYKKVKEYFEFCKESVRKTGRSVTLTGRERPIPDINSKNPMIRQAAERLAMNTPLQGTAADLIKLAMIDIDRYLLKNQELGSMLLQIHDELLFESPDRHVEELAAVAKQSMETIFKLKVPLIVDISIGKNWGEC